MSGWKDDGVWREYSFGIPQWSDTMKTILNRQSNEQNSHILQKASTKECGLEDENAGETLPDRPLAECADWTRWIYPYGWFKEYDNQGVLSTCSPSRPCNHV